MNPPRRVIVHIYGDEESSSMIRVIGPDGNIQYKICFTTIIIVYNDGDTTEVPLSNCIDGDLIPDKASTICPEPSGEIGIITSSSCPPGYVKDILGLCAPIESINNELSEQSPYKVDMSKVLDSIYLPTVTDSMKIASEKFLCAYTKLTTSNSFKNLFTNVFGGSQDVLNVEFKITKDLMNKGKKVNGLTSGISASRYTSTGEIASLNILIEIDEALLNSNSTFNSTKTILHESIHAFLILKMLNCNPSYPYDYYEGFELSEMLYIFFNTLCAYNNDFSDQHDFMFDYMLPTFEDVFNEIGLSNLASQEDIDRFLNNTDLNWDDFHYYFSLQGLHTTQAFINEIQNDPIKLALFYKYVLESNNMTNECENQQL